MKYKESKMKIKNLTPDVSTYTAKIVQGKQEHSFDFGKIKESNPATFKALIEGATAKAVRVGCTLCTKATISQKGANVELEVIYDAKNIGFFNKTVIVTLTDNSNIIFKTTGTVI